MGVTIRLWYLCLVISRKIVSIDIFDVIKTKKKGNALSDVSVQSSIFEIPDSKAC